MSVEVPCPQCGSILRAPAGSAGRKARCKKCRHGFRLPGDAVSDDVGQESTQLSVVDEPAFSFVSSTDEPTVSGRRSKSKYKSSIGAGGKGRSSSGNAGPMLTILGVVAVLIAGAVGAYFYMNPAQPPEQAAGSSAPVPKEPANETAQESPKKDNMKPAIAAAPKVAEKQPSRRTSVTGGMKLPPPPEKADSFRKPTAKASVDTEYDKIHKLFATGGDSPVAAILWASDPGFQGAGVKDTVDRYSMASGERIDRTIIEVGNAVWPRACDLSPGGDHFITEGPVGTLTLYDLNAKAKLGTPFKPFAGNPEVPTPSLAAALFVDEKTVIVAAVDGRIESWNAREGTRIGAGSVGTVTLTATSCAMKPNRSAMLIVAGATLQEMPAATLTPQPILSLPHGGGDGLAIAMDRSDRIAVAYRAKQPGTHTRFVVARSGDEKPSADLHLDDSAGIPNALSWCGPEAFTASLDSGTAFVYETEVNKPLATLSPRKTAKHALVGDRDYVLMPDTADAKKCVLVGIAFPPDDYLPLRNEAVADRKPIGFLVTAEGYGR